MPPRFTRRTIACLLSGAMLCVAATAQAQTRVAAVPQPALVAVSPAERAYLDNLGRLLEARLAGKSVGYAVVAMLPSGASVARSGGDARRAPDPFPRAMSVDDKITIASVSKVMTATAVMKLLARRNLSADTPVWPYLPSSWTLGPNVKTITFRELMSHRAGIRCDTPKTYAGVRACFEAGVDAADKAEQKYNNINYAAFRLILPRLDGMPDALARDLDVRDLDARERRGDHRPAAIALAERYHAIMNREVFAPAGLPTMHCRYTDAKPALSYKSLNPSDPLDFAVVGPGEDWGDSTLRCGSAGWFFSARQLAIFTHALTRTSKILSGDLVQQMKSENLGLWARSHGEVTWHGHGGFHPAERNRGELHTFVGAFSNGLTIGLVVNSKFKGRIAAEIARAIREAEPASVAGKG
jgi:CubicO group peptidase (beta-lactamase class C family)